ncbi:MAG: type II toxin-antitoxin system RelE/ParE family toxin [Opitutales bacterium]|jgi:plasmid maintenance system killer protein
MIHGFGCKETERVFRQEFAKPKVIPLDLQERLLEVLQVLDAAERLTDLYFPPSNGLKKVVNTSFTYELRVDRRYRVYFEWDGDHALNVRFGDHL